jgi:hypothetical protein
MEAQSGYLEFECLLSYTSMSRCGVAFSWLAHSVTVILHSTLDAHHSIGGNKEA